jgi:hypothetical protein
MARERAGAGQSKAGAANDGCSSCALLPDGEGRRADYDRREMSMLTTTMLEDGAFAGTIFVGGRMFEVKRGTGPGRGRDWV